MSDPDKATPESQSQTQPENIPGHEPSVKEPGTRELVRFVESAIPSAIEYFESRVSTSAREQLGGKLDAKSLDAVIAGDWMTETSTYPYDRVGQMVEDELQSGKVALDREKGDGTTLSDGDIKQVEDANATHVNVKKDEEDEGRVMEVASSFDPQRVDQSLKDEGLLPMDEVDSTVVERYVNDKTGDITYRLMYVDRGPGGSVTTLFYDPKDNKINVASLEERHEAIQGFASTADLDPKHIQDLNLKVRDGRVVTEVTTYPSTHNDPTTSETRVVDNNDYLNERVSSALVRIVNDVNRIGMLDPGEATPVYCNVVFNDFQRVMRMGDQPGELQPTRLTKASRIVIRPNKEDGKYEELDIRDPFGFVKEYTEDRDQSDEPLFKF